MEAKFVKIYDCDYVRISHNSNAIYITADQAEKLWQDLMIKCEEFRRNVKVELKN